MSDDLLPVAVVALTGWEWVGTDPDGEYRVPVIALVVHPESGQAAHVIDADGDSHQFKDGDGRLVRSR